MSIILAIETSCDETAAAVVAGGQRILSNVVASQIDLHRRYGGVFPEVASRQHVLSINPVVEEAMQQAAVGWDEVDAVAVTEGPGLAGSLLVGVNAAKGIAFMRGLPLVAVNHLEGHVYSNWLAPEVKAEVQNSTSASASAISFPVLVLIVSGGHTELVLMEDHGRYRRLGGTLDDAAGEAFDKAARLLGLPYPGGPVVQRAAAGSDPGAFDLPRALMTQPEHRYNFSFSGLKTAVLRLVREQQEALDDPAWPEAYVDGVLAGAEKETWREGERVIRDIAASFQTAVADALVTKTLQAARDFGVAHLCVCGGVAANGELRRQLAERVPQTLIHRSEHGGGTPATAVETTKGATTEGTPLRYSIPPIWLCTDNAAMIGAAAHYRFVAGVRTDWDLDVKARLPLASWGLPTG